MEKSFIGVGLCIFAAFICIYFYLVQQERPVEDQRERSLVVGIASGYFPFVGLDAQGGYEGFDIDVARSCADRMGKELVFKDCGSMASLFIALEQGMVDVIMWGLSITQSRLAKIAMVKYYGDDVCSYALIAWDKSIPQMRSLDDCAGWTICVESGSVQEKMLDLYPVIKKFAVDRVDDALFNIQYGKADAALVEIVIAKKFKTLFPSQVLVVDIPLNKADCEFGFGVGINQNNRALIEIIRRTIAGLQVDGTIDSLAKKWGLE